MEHSAPQVEAQPVDKKKIRHILKVMGYLALITTGEFIIAFTAPEEWKYIKVVVFILMTIWKAFYIVSEFMHLGHEKKSLKMSIVLPMLFVVFFIFIMIYQGGAIFDSLN